MGKTTDARYAVGSQQKHPHGRGEDQCLQTSPLRWPETPPRAWGRPHRRHQAGLYGGNTPTGVGKTPTRNSRRTKCQKHPHGRGEDSTPSSLARAHLETPPRAWGRLGNLQVSRSLPRNTPTGVGKTYPDCHCTRYTEKHPHGRGEDVPGGLHTHVTPETPPRAWGRRSRVRLQCTEDGNTPTGVGKTKPSWRLIRPAQKHPHGRGEDNVSMLPSARTIETPPRAWGRQGMSEVARQAGGNTPTGVGKTGPLRKLPTCSGKHPHGRGEDGLKDRASRNKVETPPRAWGRQN